MSYGKGGEDNSNEKCYKGNKITPFEQELIETVKKINEYKEACEANVVSIFI